MIIVSGPSTVGKNPFIYQACKMYNLQYITPFTTRKIRDEEKVGVDYNFLSMIEFQSKIRNNEIDEWDFCLENYYGYIFDFPGNRKQITHGLSRMALRIKSRYPDKITTIFLMPSDKDRIMSNLKQIYKGKTLLLREALVEEEICHASLFDEVFMVSENATDILKSENVKKCLGLSK